MNFWAVHTDIYMNFLEKNKGSRQLQWSEDMWQHCLQVQVCGSQGMQWPTKGNSDWNSKKVFRVYSLHNLQYLQHVAVWHGHSSGYYGADIHWYSL